MSSKLIYCPHCECEVAERTYRLHKGIYYSATANTWTKQHNNSTYDCSPSKKRQYEVTLQKELNVPIARQTTEHTSDTNNEVIENLADEFFFSENKNEFDELENTKLDKVRNFVTDRFEEVWEDITLEDLIRDISFSDSSISNPVKRNDGNTGSLIEIAQWTILFVGSWSTAYNIPMNAIGYLLVFLHAFLIVCSIYSPVLKVLAGVIPNSVYSLKKAQGCLEDDFDKYVVCPDCNSVYKLSQCLSDSGNSLRCSFVKFPDHPQHRFRKKCNFLMFKEVILQEGGKKLYPIKTFCFRSIQKSLKKLLDRKGFQQLCELWRTRKTLPGTLRDVYDGRVWRNFLHVNSEGFLELPRRYGLILNIDWFQPFKHSPYSVGVIYLALLNLPRDQRYKQENIIIAGVIPGPDEPKGCINSYLRPLVDDLKELWETGMDYKGIDDNKNQTYFAALLCCACDVPAARKVCGFLGHSAKVGCSKCKKEFKSGKFGEKMDFGGFDSNIEPRKDGEHRRLAAEIQKERTMTKRHELEKRSGVRYTELMRLKYYDCITFTVIDPMHNLYLGTARHMFKTIWAEKLSSSAMSAIQKMVDDMVVPTTLGRIPKKIETSFSSFTSEQWKNWTLYFSAIALKPHLPRQDYSCWLLFVEACRMLTVPSITINNLRLGHEKLMLFCRTFETLYGSMAVTPNMHLHSHLIQCIIDYGPMHVFWLFSFERMNGILGSFHTNQRSVEIQMMRRLLNMQSIQAFEKPEIFSDSFLKAFAFEDKSKNLKGKHADVVLRVLSLSTNPVVIDRNWMLDADITFIGSRYDAFMSDHYRMFLKTSLQYFCDINVDKVSGSCHKYKSIEMCGEIFGSSDSRLSRSSVILASWCGKDGEINKTVTDIRPGFVRFYITFYVEANGNIKQITMAFVHWLQRVLYKNDFCPLVGVWCHKLFEPEGPACFMPVQRIACKCICAPVCIKNEKLIAVVPHIRQLYW